MAKNPPKPKAKPKMKPKPKPATGIRDRIKELRRVRAGDLAANPKNWRTHPPEQVQAIQGVLKEIGYADALLARELPGGALELIDGHARQALDPEQIVPVLVLDLDQDEAAKLMTVLDPLAAMATVNEAALESLLAEIETDSAALQAMFDELAKKSSAGEPIELKPLETQPPPKMAWVLVGLPVVRFSEIAERVESLAGVEGIILETTQNDGQKNR